jgi:hypothetical protein
MKQTDLPAKELFHEPCRRLARFFNSPASLPARHELNVADCFGFNRAS